uniref:Uncharacterized protein n=1 Tax=Trichogramma kaykai TaxID=54128 RepID=A0ABD2VWI0_9HYME
MSLFTFWPVVALFVVGVIMVILKYGSRFLKLRHDTTPPEDDWEGKSYSRELSNMIFNQYLLILGNTHCHVRSTEEIIQ